MGDPSTLRPAEEGLKKSLQDYIDEKPVWADGTALTSVPMTRMQ